MDELAACAKVFPGDDPDEVIAFIRSKGVPVMSCLPDEITVFWRYGAAWVLHVSVSGAASFHPAWDALKGCGARVFDNRRLIAQITAGHIRRAIRKAAPRSEIPEMYQLGRYSISIQYQCLDGKVKTQRQGRVDVESGELRHFLGRRVKELRAAAQAIADRVGVLSANAVLVNERTNIAVSELALIPELSVGGWVKTAAAA